MKKWLSEGSAILHNRKEKTIAKFQLVETLNRSEKYNLKGERFNERI